MYVERRQLERLLVAVCLLISIVLFNRANKPNYHIQNYLFRKCHQPSRLLKLVQTGVAILHRSHRPGGSRSCASTPPTCVKGDGKRRSRKQRRGVRVIQSKVWEGRLESSRRLCVAQREPLQVGVTLIITILYER